MLRNVIHRLVADTKIPISDNAYYTQTCQLQCTLSKVAKVRRKISLNVSIHHVHTLNLKRLLKYIANTDDHCSFYTNGG